MLCVKCKKRTAVVFIQRMENGQPKQEGYCLTCARALGIKPVDDLMKQFGMRDEDLEAMEERMNSFMEEAGENGMSGMFPFAPMGEEEGDGKENDSDEEFTPGGSATFPFGFGAKGDKKKEKEKGRKRQMRRWALTVLLASFLITALLSLASGEIIEGLPMFASILVLVLFVALGIVFDIIGLAVATADVTAFNSMAARRLKTGKKAVWLISNTEKVSSVCNDVIGDIAGVVSGATGAAIAAQLFSESASGFWLSLTLTSLIAAVTVGGKALGKQYAVRYNEKIVYWVAKLLCGFQK